jgi:hypothetical protein
METTANPNTTHPGIGPRISTGMAPVKAVSAARLSVRQRIGFGKLRRGTNAGLISLSRLTRQPQPSFDSPVSVSRFRVSRAACLRVYESAPCVRRSPNGVWKGHVFR